MVKGNRAAWKASYFTKVTTLFDNFSKCFVVGADNVGSTQMQEIRASMRGKATLLMGKNTMMRKAMRGHIENIPGLENLLPLIVYNVGLVFTNDDLCEVRDLLLMNKKRAPARPCAVASCIVTVPTQNTGLGPERTNFFQALQIPTKISRGTIEIVNDIQLLKEGDKVGLSEATLLNMLNISPFTFMEGLAAITAVSLAIKYLTVASVPHSVVNGFKNLLAVAAVTDYSFKEAETLKEIVAGPSKLAALQAAAAAAPAAGEAPAVDAGAPAAKEAANEKPEEESDDDMGFGLFD
ncbi:Ribosomal protein L10P [Trinorchestia longiramus]|nr:Ribosomal protein L10P [Trinorchestia longiramus]